MARVVIVVGSRRNGNSALLAKIISSELAKERISCDTIVPGNQKIYLCTGCMDCDNNGICDFKDDMEKNINKIRNAEIIIFITPVRWNTLSGDLKIFIDRLNPLFSTKALKNKKMITLAIGSKARNEYSLDGAITSLGSFIESAEADLIYHNSFGNCLDFNDILNQQDKINAMIADLKKCIN